MKKILVLMLTLALALTSFTACGGNDDAKPNPGESDTQVEENVDEEADADKKDEDKDKEDKKENKEEDKEDAASTKPENNKPSSDNKPSSGNKPSEDKKPVSSIKNAHSLLSKVWAKHSDDEKFPAVGHDGSDGASGVSTSDTNTLCNMLFVPESMTAKIENAASLMHMMNANTFTAGAFKIKKSSDAKSFSNAMKDRIKNNEWMCGFPEKLVIIQVEDNYIVSAFGNADLINTFKSKVTGTYKSSKVLCDEGLSF